MTTYINGLDNLIATARSNKIAVFLGFQDFSQMVRDYGQKIADAIVNTVNNVLSELSKVRLQRNWQKVLVRRP